MTDRKKPGVAFWATVALVVVLVGYLLSFGQACWAVDQHLLPTGIVARLYYPCVVVAWGGTAPDSMSEALWWWATLPTPDSQVVVELGFAAVSN